DRTLSLSYIKDVMLRTSTAPMIRVSAYPLSLSLSLSLSLCLRLLAGLQSRVPEVYRRRHRSVQVASVAPLSSRAFSVTWLLPYKYTHTHTHTHTHTITASYSTSSYLCHDETHTI